MIIMDCTNIKLTKGTKNSNVKTLQESLTKLGFYDGLIDGDYGIYTESSVKEFQKMFSLTVDGWIGSETCKKINNLIDCNINLKLGSTGDKVRIIQKRLKQQGLYNSEIDGSYGNKTVTAVKQYQKNNGLFVDGVVGSITCGKLLAISSSNSGVDTGLYTDNTLCEENKPDCKGQISGYHCGPHSIKQSIRKLGVYGYSESKIGSYAGTTSSGTGHMGLETAIAKIAKLEGLNIDVEWKNYSELGGTRQERFNNLRNIMKESNKSVFLHLLYRNKYGHYEKMKTLNKNSTSSIISNSLGNKSGSGYKGYDETRSLATQESYIRGISQKSICILTLRETGKGPGDSEEVDLTTYTGDITVAENKRDYIRGVQEYVDVLYKQEGLSNRVLELQVWINTQRNKYNIPDKEELIYSMSDGDFAQ